MTRWQRSLVLVGLVTALGTAGVLRYAAGGDNNKDAGQRTFAAGVVLHVVPKAGDLGFLLKEPSVYVLGGESFVCGAPLYWENAGNVMPKRAWVPLKNISHIEEYESIKAVKQALNFTD